MEATKMALAKLKTRAPFPSIVDESYSTRLTQKWRPFLEGIENDYTRRVTAMLYENQTQELRGQRSYLAEETRAVHTGPFTKFIFPIIRRVYPNLIANALVSVQPMTAPVGAIFFFRYRYGTTKGTVAAGDEMTAKFDRFYASEIVTGEVVGTGDGSTTFTSTLDFTPVRQTTLRVTATVTSAGVDKALVGVDNGAGAITGTVDTITVTGTINYVTGEVSLTYSSAPKTGTNITADYEYNSELNPNVPQVNLDVELLEIRAKTRKLKALWSSEAADDLRALHGMDIESELVAGISSEIAMEIDREIIQDLLQAATVGDPFFKRSFAVFDAKAPTGVDKYTHIRSMIIPISQVSNTIHKKTRRAPANWLVVSPEVAGLMDALPFFTSTDPAQYTYTGTVIKIGVLQSKWTVYKDPFLPTNTILCGYQGPSFLDTGFVYAPYVPLQVTPTFLDPADFTFRKGVRTRYGKKLVRPEFYGFVRVNNVISDTVVTPPEFES